jgi:hypothetical protein
MLLATPGLLLFVCTPGPQPDSVQTGIRLDSSAYAPGIRRDLNSHITKERSAGRRHLNNTAEPEEVDAVGGAQVRRVFAPPAAAQDALNGVSRATTGLALYDKAASLPPKNGLGEKVFAQPPANGMGSISDPTIHRLPYLFPVHFTASVTRLKMPQLPGKPAYVIWPYSPVCGKETIAEKICALFDAGNTPQPIPADCCDPQSS